VRTLLIPILKLVAITVPLTWLWLEGGRDLYHQIFIHVTHPMLVWFGSPNSVLATVPQRFIGYVPFLALMLITPGLSMRRRLWGTLIGSVLLFLSHAGFALANIASYARYGETPEAIRWIFPMILLVDSMPFVLWAVIAREVLRKSLGTAAGKIFAKSP
jgi:hypothetical protein